MMLSLGRILVTPGILQAFPDPQDLAVLLRRHASGDWGQVSEEDRLANDNAVRSGERILSKYEVNGTRVWVVTGADRSVTTILLPQEY